MTFADRSGILRQQKARCHADQNRTRAAVDTEQTTRPDRYRSNPSELRTGRLVIVGYLAPT
jgi:hypothetical protein